MPRKIGEIVDDHGLIPLILSRPAFHTGELLDLLHGFPAAPFRDSELARREIARIVSRLAKDGEIVKTGMRFCETIYKRNYHAPR